MQKQTVQTAAKESRSEFNKDLIKRLKTKFGERLVALDGSVSISLRIRDRQVASILYAKAREARIRLNEYDPKKTTLKGATKRKVKANGAKTTWLFRSHDIEETVEAIATHATDLESKSK